MIEEEAKTDANDHSNRRGIVEALDAHELAIERGEVNAAAAWRIRIYHGQGVVHGAWFEGGSCFIFVLVRMPRAQDSDSTSRGLKGHGEMQGESATRSGVCEERWDSGCIDWDGLMAALQHLDQDCHSS